jgi:hypothetical protein
MRSSRPFWLPLWAKVSEPKRLGALLFIASAAGAQAPVERDSAGIRIISNPSRETAPVVFRLGAPTLDLGGAADNPDLEFRTGPGGRASFISGLRMPDRTVAVPDGVRIQFFDAKGGRDGTVGRYGSGPSEFRSLWATAFCRTRGDTLVADDRQNGRFAVIHGKQVVRTTAHGQLGDFVGCLDDGTILVGRSWPGRRDPTYAHQLSRVRLDGMLVNPFNDFIFRTPSTVARTMFGIIRPAGRRVYAGDGATSEVRVYRADGPLTHIIRSADAPRKITAADVELALKGTHPSVREQWRPETFATYSDFLVDPDGRLWVKDFPPAQPAERIGWTAFDINGRLIGRLEVPRAVGKTPFQIVAFGVNEVVVWRVDDDGFSRLAFYPIVKAP